jgi:N-sulfoglucosamine sulfohydrolase
MIRTLCALLLAVTTLTAADKKPNILFCFADDWGRYASCYAAVDGRPSANDVVKTPTMDSIAKRGVIFRSAFVNAPSCTPCRSALLSGRYFFNTGRAAILLGAVWDGSVPSWPMPVKEAGYHIGKTWKVWSPGSPSDIQFGKGENDYSKHNEGGNFGGFSENVMKATAAGDSLDAAKQRMYGQVRGNFDAFLKANGDGKPWCYWFGPTNVHREWARGSGKALWDIEPESLKGKLPKFLPDVPEVREDFADYLGEAQAFDAAIGELIKMVEARGELDNTLIVISGDHGAPGFPHGKCNLYDFGVGVGLIVAGPHIPGGRVVDDIVNLMDLAPTFLDAAGAKVYPGMNGRNLMPLLSSEKSGQIEPERTWTITGRERHVDMAREGFLPYPQRALRTQDYLLIKNFHPERWPMGAPLAVTETSAPEASELEHNTRVAFPDMDAGPMKAWLVAHRNDPQWKQHYDFAFAKRPEIELFDLKRDHDQVHNLADDPAYSAVRKDLEAQLMKELERVGDPRVTGDGMTFEKPPFTGPAAGEKPRKGKGQKSK